jgi:hypothetical protein
LELSCHAGCPTGNVFDISLGSYGNVFDISLEVVLKIILIYSNQKMSNKKQLKRGMALQKGDNNEK